MKTLFALFFCIYYAIGFSQESGEVRVVGSVSGEQFIFKNIWVYAIKSGISILHEGNRRKDPAIFIPTKSNFLLSKKIIDLNSNHYLDSIIQKGIVKDTIIGHFKYYVQFNKGKKETVAQSELSVHITTGEWLFNISGNKDVFWRFVFKDASNTDKKGETRFISIAGQTHTFTPRTFIK